MAGSSAWRAGAAFRTAGRRSRGAAPPAADNPAGATHAAERLAGGLPALLVAAERVAQTIAQGVHGRRRVGLGESFWQFRAYHPGDPVQRIDWRQTARSQMPFVRELEWEAAQTVWLWRDSSASMGFGSTGQGSKRARAELMLLALAALLGRAGERVALLDRRAPPIAGRLNLQRLAGDLMRPPPGTPEGGLPHVGNLARHGEVVLFGDFLDPLPDIAESVAGFVRRQVRGHLLQILDPAERALPYTGRTRFLDPEDGAAVTVSRVEAIRGDYQAAMAAQIRGLAAIARQAGWTHAVHDLSRPPEGALLALYTALDGSMRRRGAAG